ncbi:MAG: tRNA pseudouridine(55) synthase TruB, partial [Microbacteriaceae bacterium]|nr:tRNA pseudouridine(55) synthase TruB [Microbacteriaceae bacterium]
MSAAPNGILLVDKPQGITSHDVVARVRRALGTKKVGHAGTLDPMATGLLILGVGPSTRLLTHLVGLDKEYFATIRLGAATTTDDAEGEVLSPREGSAPFDSLRSLAGPGGDERIEAGIAALTGDILQRPSSVSAIKVDGQRAYDLVRAGEEVELQARPVTVGAFEVISRRGPFDSPSARSGGQVLDLDVRVECSSGTYIRALARDLGEGLGTGGHLTALRRTKVGPFDVDAAVPVPDWVERGATPPEPPELLAPAAVAARLFPVLELDDQGAADLANGKRVHTDHLDAETVAAVAPDGRLIGLVAVRHGATRVLTNFPV